MVQNFEEFINEAINYKPEDFNLDNAPKELVQYIIDNIDRFGKRYQMAITKIDRMRCPLRVADPQLYSELVDRAEEWCDDNNKDVEDYDIDEIFDF